MFHNTAKLIEYLEAMRIKSGVDYTENEISATMYTHLAHEQPSAAGKEVLQVVSEWFAIKTYCGEPAAMGHINKAKSIKEFLDLEPRFQCPICKAYIEPGEEIGCKTGIL